MIIAVPTTPWYRDHGVLAGFAFSAALLAFNLMNNSGLGQVTGALCAAPVLAAGLVERRSRVVVVGVLATLSGLISSYVNHVPWDLSQGTRFVLIVVTTGLGYVVADSRVRQRQQLVTMREVARTAQRAIMRVEPPRVEGLEVAVRYISASQEALIGGDAYEAVSTGFGLRVLVADARGKGLPAVRSSALAVGAFREWAFVEPDLDTLILRLDESLSRDADPWDFVTALVAQLQGHRLQFAVAGHPPPLLIRDGSVRTLALQASPPLTLMDGQAQPPVGQVDLRLGDTVLLFTDGLVEARDSFGRFFPLEELLVEVVASADSAEQMADELLERLRDFVEQDLGDDVACVWLHVPHPVSSPLPDQGLVAEPAVTPSAL